jgi:Carboxypeptidase regulatory-like domain
MYKTASFLNKRVYLWAILFVLCFVFSTLAQTESGRIQGSVTDQTGAAIANATVTVTETGTKSETTVQTNDEGNYSVLALKPGKYQISVGQTNFKTTKQDITLEVAQTATLNFSLEAGAVSETVTITSDVPLVDSASSSLGSTIQGRQIVELPLNGRNVLELARLSPGVTQGVIGGFATGANGDAETYRGRNTGGAALSVNGQRTQANNFLLDGVDNNESLVNTINIFPSADAVQEFRVQTSIAPAEFGRGGGAIINTVIRSGASQYHGSSYLFLRNSAMDARPAFYDSVANQRRTPLFRRSQFGGTVGGPVMLPGVKGLKKKLFFFASYEGLRQFLPASTDTATVPTAAFRNGDFSLLLNPALSGLGSAIQLRDPSTGAIIAGNRLDLLPAGRLNAAGLNYLRAFPLPNNGNQVQGNFINTRNELDSQDVVDFRVDANLTDSERLFVRGSYGRFSQEVTSRLPTLPSGFGSGSNPTRNKAIVVGLSSALTPTLFNELRLQANRLKYGYEPPFGDVPLSQSLGIVNANRDDSLGGGALIGGYNGQLEYTGDYGPYRVPQNTYQIVDSLSQVVGNHTLKFGGSIVRRNVQLFRPVAGKGYFFLYGNGDATQCGGDALNEGGTTRFEQADLLIGFACRYDIGVQNGLVGTMTWENSAFFQDDWKASRKLTLNLGLRYDYLTNPSEQYGRQANFNLATGGLVLASDDKDTLTNTDKNNFGPRLGFAYDITGKGKSVIRGGYGMFFFLDRGGINNQLAQNPPYSGNASLSYTSGFRITLTGQGPLNNNNSTLATQPLPVPAVNTSPAFLNNPVNVSLLAIRPDNKVSNVHQFNVQYEQQLGKDSSISFAYVGTRGRNLIVYYNLNGTALTTANAAPCPITGRSLGACYPGLSTVNVRDDSGRSQYDALQIQHERRFAQGWQYIASYTFSKTKDNGEGAFDKSANGGLNYIEPFATSRLDYPQVFSFATLYEIPFGRHRAYGSDIPKALDALIGGWQLSSIFRAQSGSPFDVRVNDRLVNVTGDPYGGANGQFLDRAAFTPVAIGLGNLGRNSLRSPSTYQLNFGLMKKFSFSERLNLQFRGEAFNLTNKTQLGTPNTDYNNTNTFNGFGTIRGTSPFSNRQLQFGLRIEF